MRLPTIHLNGTSAKTLLDEAREANLALHHAIAALEGITVNARDYYVQGTEAHGEAVREHQARIDAIRKVRVELNEYIDYLLDNQRR